MNKQQDKFLTWIRALFALVSLSGIIYIARDGGTASLLAICVMGVFLLFLVGGEKLVDRLIALVNAIKLVSDKKNDQPGERKERDEGSSQEKGKSLKRG